MSTHDEALMWDILDLTSYGFSQAAELSGMRSIPDNDIAMDGNDISRSSSDEDRDDQEVEPPNSSPRKALLTSEGITEMTNETPGPDWPFSSRTGSNTVGPGVPDIPDWMIFGDLMTEHL